MHADAALVQAHADRGFPDSRLTAEANLLIMPNLDAANITFNALKIVAGEGVTVGPILLGAAKPVHILTPTSTVRRIVNMTALTAVDAASHRYGLSRTSGRKSMAAPQLPPCSRARTRPWYKHLYVPGAVRHRARRAARRVLPGHRRADEAAGRRASSS